MSSSRATLERKEWKQKEAEIAQRKKDAAAKRFWSRQYKDFDHFSETDSDAFDDIGLPDKTTDLSPGEERKLAVDFRDEVATRGYDLTYFGLFRLASFLTVQKANGRQMSAEAVEKSFERLRSLNCFSKHDLVFDPAKVTKKKAPEPQRELSLADLEKLNLSLSREDEKIGKKIVEGHYFGVEARETWSAWQDSLSQNFGYAMPEPVKKRAFELFQKRNYSYLDRRAYDSVRLALVRSGDMPDTCLTPDERLGFSIEDARKPIGDWEQRLGFANQQRQIQEIHGKQVLTN